LASNVAIAEYILVLALLTAAALAVLRLAGFVDLPIGSP